MHGYCPRGAWEGRGGPHLSPPPPPPLQVADMPSNGAWGRIWVARKGRDTPRQTSVSMLVPVKAVRHLVTLLPSLSPSSAPARWPTPTDSSITQWAIRPRWRRATTILTTLTTSSTASVSESWTVLTASPHSHWAPFLGSLLQRCCGTVEQADPGSPGSQSSQQQRHRRP